MATAGSIDRTRPRPRLKTFENVVEEFIACWRVRAKAEHRWFAAQPSLKDAIRTAAMARCRPEGRCGPKGKPKHQWRIRNEVLTAWRDELVENESAIKTTKTFDELHEVVAKCRVHGIGALSRAVHALTLPASNST